MAFTCNKTTPVGLSRNSDSTWLTPLYADATGTWALWIGDDVYTFAGVENELLTLPDHFTNGQANTFQLRRPNGTLFDNTCYVFKVNYSLGNDYGYKEIRRQGKVSLVLDSETATEYQNDILVNLADWDVYVEGLLMFDGVTYNPNGTFTWSLEAEQRVIIKYYKI